MLGTGGYALVLCKELLLFSSVGSLVLRSFEKDWIII